MPRQHRGFYQTKDGGYASHEPAIDADGNSYIYRRTYTADEEQLGIEEHNRFLRENAVNSVCKIHRENGFRILRNGDVRDIVIDKVEKSQDRRCLAQYLDKFCTIMGDSYCFNALAVPSEFSLAQASIETSFQSVNDAKRYINQAVHLLKKDSKLPTNFPTFSFKATSIKTALPSRAQPTLREYKILRDFLLQQLNHSSFNQRTVATAMYLYLECKSFFLPYVEVLRRNAFQGIHLLIPRDNKRTSDSCVNIDQFMDVFLALAGTKEPAAWLFSKDLGGSQKLTYASVILHFRQTVSPRLFTQVYTLKQFRALKHG